MNNNMYINVEQLSSSIEKLKALKNRLNSIFNKQKENTSKISNVWNGTVGEKAYSELTKHNNYYDSYIEKINEKISFLEKTRDAYLKNDSLLSSKIDDNANK